MACECPSPYCEYDGNTVDVIAGGKTIQEAEDNAKAKAEKEARRVAEAALAAAIRIGDKVCKPHTPPCEAWFRIMIGKADAQEYPFHGEKRQFGFGWCDWKLVVKCELPKAAKRAEGGKGKKKGKLY